MTDTLKKYKALCAKNDWAVDDDQLAALTALNTMENRMLAARSLWAKLRGKRQLPGGVYLYGGVGRGKTFVMDLFFQNTAITQKRRCHFHEFMIEIHDRLHEKRQFLQDQQDTATVLTEIAEEIAADTRLLCFDEMFVNDVADAMLLGRLFTAFFNAGMGIVFTSNIRPDDLYENGLQRERFIPFITLLKSQSHIIHFDGRLDYRAGRLRDHKRYTYPARDQARADMLELFSEFADDKTPSHTQVNVKGRVLDFPKTVNGVVMTRFDALCGVALGAEDYLTLCDEFSTFIVQDIPVLDDLQRNEVKRFITLIDTLYEKRKLTFFTAEKAIEYIYTGQQYKKEFERTQSRIMEMQSPSYPHKN